jgi:alpha-tubulin suppressor-like RCC1 family protein
VLTLDGRAFGWGSNSKGQLGVGDQAVGGCIAVPTHITIEDDESIAIIGVGSGRAHTLLLRGDGSMYGCGDNKYDQLGVLKGKDSTSVELLTAPRRVEWSSPQIVIEVCCGWQFSAARAHSGQVFTWGDNRKGQCGQNKIVFQKTVQVPTCVPLTFEDCRTTSIIQIACGWSHMLALGKSGSVFSWGRSDMGQLGVDDEQLLLQKKHQKKQGRAGGGGGGQMIFKISMPVKQKLKNRIIQIACGSEHSMAVTSGGDLYSWGWGEHGNLGHGTTKNQRLPTRVVHFGAEKGCYVREIRSCGACVFAMIARTTVV